MSTAKLKRPVSPWTWSGHEGWYGGGWLCGRCFGFWESFLALRDDRPCPYARPVQVLGASK